MHVGHWRAAALLVLVVAAQGCAAPSPPQAVVAADTQSVDRLSDAVLRLGPRVAKGDAQQLARVAHATSRDLAREYRTVGSAHFQNFLVNIGVRERGLCFQWTEDLMRQLFAARLKTVELHWGTAYRATWREHNCVVVTAVGQPFEDGIVLDAWRDSGRLFWSPVARDHYPWREEQDPSYVRRASAAQRPAAEAGPTDG